MRWVVALLALAASSCFSLDPVLFDFERRGAYVLPADDAAATRELVPLVASDGVRIWALWLQAARAGCVPALLYCQGNSEDLQDHYHRLKQLRDLGYDVLTFDYRGNGMSEGSPSEEGVYRDGRAALAELRRRARGPVLIYGTSFGSTVCTQLAVERPPTVLHLDCPLLSIDSLVRDGSGLGLPASLLTRWRFDNGAKIGQVGRPVQIFHGDRDDYIRPEYGEELYRRAAEPKDFWLVPGADHGGIPDAPGYGERLAWMTPYLEAACPGP